MTLDLKQGINLVDELPPSWRLLPPVSYGSKSGMQEMRKSDHIESQIRQHIWARVAYKIWIQTRQQLTREVPAEVGYQIRDELNT